MRSPIFILFILASSSGFSQSPYFLDAVKQSNFSIAVQGGWKRTDLSPEKGRRHFLSEIGDEDISLLSWISAGEEYEWILVAKQVYSQPHEIIFHRAYSYPNRSLCAQPIRNDPKSEAAYEACEKKRDSIFNAHVARMEAQIRADNIDNDRRRDSLNVIAEAMNKRKEYVVNRRLFVLENFSTIFPDDKINGHSYYLKISAPAITPPEVECDGWDVHFCLHEIVNDDPQIVNHHFHAENLTDDQFEKIISVLKTAKVESGNSTD